MCIFIFVIIKIDIDSQRTYMKKKIDHNKVAKLTHNKAFNALILVTAGIVFAVHGLEERLEIRRGRIPEVAKHKKIKF